MFEITERPGSSILGVSKKARAEPHAVENQDQPNPERKELPVSKPCSANHGPKVQKLDPESRAWLLRVHKNLGHPDVQKLQIFLRECKVDSGIVEAVPDLHCPTCHEPQGPKIGRPAAIHPVREFDESCR